MEGWSLWSSQSQGHAAFRKAERARKGEREKGERVGNRPFSPSVLFFFSQPVSVHLQHRQSPHQHPSSAGRTLLLNKCIHVKLIIAGVV